MSAPAEDVITVLGPVADQRRALAFNARMLELKLAGVGETMPCIRRVQVTANGTTRLRLVTWWEPMPPRLPGGLVLRCSDLAADYQRLVAAGMEFDGPPFAGPDGTCQAVWYHPHGNALVLQSDKTDTMMTRSRPQARPSYDAV